MPLVSRLTVKDVSFIDIDTNASVSPDTACEGHHELQLIVEQKLGYKFSFIYNQKPRTLVYNSYSFDIGGKHPQIGDVITMCLEDSEQQILSISSPNTSCVRHSGLNEDPHFLLRYIGEFDPVSNSVNMSAPEYNH